MEYCNIKREEIDETLGEFDYGADLEIIKNEELVRQFCTDELDIKDELEENSDEPIKGTFNYTDDEIDNCYYRLAYNRENDNADEMAETSDAILNEKNSWIQTTSNLSADDNYKNISNSYLNNLVTEGEFGNNQTLQKLALPTCKLVHTKKSFLCTVCGLQYLYKSHLVTHMRIHTGEKPFHCGVCDYKFAHKYMLVGHIRMHTGEKPFHCGVCDYKFPHKYMLVRHMRMQLVRNYLNVVFVITNVRRKVN